MDNTISLYALLGFAALLCVPSVWKSLVNNYKLRFIPTVGSSWYWASYFGALRFFRHSPSIVQEGYNKYRGSVFKVPMIAQWLILVSGPEMIDEVRSASDDYLSVDEAFRETLHLDLTLGPDVLESRYHVEVIKQPLTRNIGPKFADLQDELEAAFSDRIKFQGNEWVTVLANSIIIDIVCRTSNRMFVGLPLCRNSDYLQLNKQFAIDLFKSARIIDLFPNFLQPFVATLLPNLQSIKRGYKHLGPLFEDRLEQGARKGKDWSERPNDAISWILEYNTNPEHSNERQIRKMVHRMLQINASAIHTTTMAFMNVLYDLATRPEYVQSMREEVEAVMRDEGWSKVAVGQLRKLDSFIKESLRLSSFLLFVMRRKVMKDFTFSNGLTVPAGNLIAVPVRPTHVDPQHFDDPATFDGFRFEKLRNEEGEENKHQLISLDPNYISFGHGRNACPGRFLAAVELKAMLAHILINYDVKMANGGKRPANWVIGSTLMPDPTAQVMFRKRV